MTPSPIGAPKILLEGPGGTGKTYALRTLAASGIAVRVLSLDPQGLEVLADTEPSGLAWHTIRPTGRSFETLLAEAKRLSSLTFDGITKAVDARKSQQTRMLQVYETLFSFIDDRTQRALGNVEKWGTGEAIAIDHLTELSQAAKEWAVGEKLVLHEGEWQIAQNILENLIRQLTTACRCWVILIAHIDREVDAVRGGTKIMAHTLGRKLAPKLPPLFSDVILSEREGKEFRWSTASLDVDLKTRNLPIEAKLPPDFGPIVRAWKARGGIVEAL